LILEFKRKEAKFSQSSQRLMKQIKEASLGRFNLCLICEICVPYFLHLIFELVLEIDF